MAIQKAIYLSGRVHNLVFFERNGKHIARIQAQSVRQSSATRKRSINFGLAAATGRKLRMQLQALLPFPKDRSLQVKFSGAISKWLGTLDAAAVPASQAIPYVSTFSFNDHTTVRERWKLPLSVTASAGALQLCIPSFIPAQCITAPAHTIAVECAVCTVSCHLTEEAYSAPFVHNLHIPYNNLPVPAQLIDITVPPLPGYLLVTVIRLTYQLAGGRYCRSENFLPASVVDARYC